MSLLDGLTQNTSQSASKSAAASLGGYKPEPSDIYGAVCNMVYIDKSQNTGTVSVNFEFTFKTKAGDKKQIKHTCWVSHKGGEWEKDGKPARGLAEANMIIGLLSQDATADLFSTPKETKTVKLFNGNEEREVLTKLLNKPVKIGILHEISDKQEKIGGKYYTTGEVRESNECQTFFCAHSNKVFNEFRDGTDAEFYQTWIAEHQGKVNDRAKKVDKRPAGVGTGNPNAGGGAVAGTGPAIDI